MSTPSAPPPLFELSNIHRRFALGRTVIHALRGVDLRVESGEFLALWGPSGSGKTTLLNLLGLLDEPDQGQVLFDGEDIAHLDDDQLSDCRNRKIGFVFQNFNLVPVLTALENVMLPLQLQARPLPAAELRERAREALARVGLEALGEFRPDQLSGGQRQRVAIARALIGQPRLVIADEPTANLDSQTSDEVITLMERLNRDTGVTCIFATHDPRLLERVPRQVRVRDGRLSEEVAT